MNTRHPLITREGSVLLHRLLEHPHAPRWNHACGDRLDGPGLERVREFEQHLQRAAGQPAADGVPAWALEFAGRCLRRVPFHRARTGGAPAPRDTTSFTALPTCDRADLNRDFVSFVPDGEPLDDLIVYETSGTTGHPVTILSHPLVSNLYLPLLRTALAARGVTLEGGPGRVAIALVCAQSFTYTYASLSAYLGGAGFVKVNLNPLDGATRRTARRFSTISRRRSSAATHSPCSSCCGCRCATARRRWSPPRWRSCRRSRANSRTASAVPCSICTRSTSAGCWRPPRTRGGTPGRPGRCARRDRRPRRPARARGRAGEITLTCGRNPFLPLLRYRTGDFARLERRAGATVLADLEGRAPVVFLDAEGRGVNGMNVPYLLKPFPLARYALHQSADHALRLSCRVPPSTRGSCARAGEDLRRPPARDRRRDPCPGGSSKSVTYTTDLPDAWRDGHPAYRSFTFREIMRPQGR